MANKSMLVRIVKPTKQKWVYEELLGRTDTELPFSVALGDFGESFAFSD